MMVWRSVFRQRSLPTSDRVDTGMGDRVRVQFLVLDRSRYVTSHPGQFRLAIHSWVGAMSTGQTEVTPCGLGVKAGIVRVWMAGKTV